MYSLYLLKCADGSLYCGITTDVRRRLGEHKQGKGGNYTRSHKVLKVVYTEKCKGRSAASKREAAVKKLTKLQKLILIKRKGRQVRH